MKLLQTIRRGLNLFKVGQAFRKVLKETDQGTRSRAKNYLMEVLGTSRGLPAKVGQLMTMDGEDIELRETLNASIPALPFELVESLLDKAYGVPHKTIFSKLDKSGKPASLGQVHWGRLKDGREIAIKIQFPEIDQSIEAEMTLMGFFPKIGPIAKWGFNMKDYRDLFWNKFDEELDYKHEARNQEYYKKNMRSLPEIVIPQIIPEFCKPNILVQSREDGVSLDEAEKFNWDIRQRLGKILLHHYFQSIFKHGFVHADPHPGNFAFRSLTSTGPQVVLYDFGSCIKIPEQLRITLMRIILALRKRESIDPASCLMALGFDIKKMLDLRPHLPALLDLMFEPFLIDGPYDVTEWNMSERVDNLVGDLKWWFRSAAPPVLIYLIRTLHGLISILKRLGAKPSWKFCLDDQCGEFYERVRSFKMPDLPDGIEEGAGFQSLSQYLKIHVKKPNGNSVRLTMPARAADNLEGIMEDKLKETLKRQGLNLMEIQSQVRKNLFVRQILFEVHDPERDVKVWLE